MAAETKQNIGLEIGHVLFIDIVGYSKLLIDEQRDYLHTLNEVVRRTDSFRAADAAGKLTRLPTGDGMALVFATTPDAPVSCAIEISNALRSHPELRVRMGIHSGPVSGTTDVNDRSNVAGAGINLAQRVMDCGGGRHIQKNKHVADDLEQYRQWRSHLHDLGECEVKHDVRVHVVNLYTDELGNRELPEKFQQAKATLTAPPTSAPVAKAAPRSRILIAALIIAAAVATGFYIFSHRPTPIAPPSASAPTPAAVVIPEKSIAVLPFENLSRDPDNAYFADGIQDEILTRLAKIADLKVISHTSTQHYKSAPENLPEIAKLLGVAHILEGSVQKAGDQVRINTQLIRAATDEHLWAESYDRKLENIFGVEAEVATAVAEALKTKLTGAEQKALEQRPTNSPEAYDAYLGGLANSLRPGYSRAENDDAIKFFREAVRLDPKFAVAWAWLAHESALGCFNQIGADFQALCEEAKRAADQAITLQPDLAESCLAQGYSYYYGQRDFDSAIAWFEKARNLSPKNSQIPQALALVCRRLGEWQRSLDYFRQATQLDPRDA